MPNNNPFAKMKPANAHAAQTPDKPEILDHYEHVHPYRGVENHGVDYGPHVEPPPGFDGRIVVEPLPPKPEPKDAVPVRIVNVGPDDFKDWRNYHTYSSGIVTQIADRNTSRSSLKITNLDAARTVYLGPTPAEANAQNGYTLLPGKDFSTAAYREVYAVTDDGATVVQLNVFVEFVVNG